MEISIVQPQKRKSNNSQWILNQTYLERVFLVSTGVAYWRSYVCLSWCSCQRTSETFQTFQHLAAESQGIFRKVRSFFSNSNIDRCLKFYEPIVSRAENLWLFSYRWRCGFRAWDQTKAEAQVTGFIEDRSEHQDHLIGGFSIIFDCLQFFGMMIFTHLMFQMDRTPNHQTSRRSEKNNQENMAWPWWKAWQMDLVAEAWAKPSTLGIGSWRVRFW